MAGRVTMLTGGSRSGKSRRALELAAGYGRRVFVATAEPLDGEMTERIRRHRAERGEGFTTVEEPLDLGPALAGLADAEVAVVDCLTVWLGNLMYHRGIGDLDGAEVAALLAALRAPRCDLVVVTNEVGMGIVPGDAESRLFRDLAGGLNQRVAAVADRVEVMISGLPLVLKQA